MAISEDDRIDVALHLTPEELKRLKGNAKQLEMNFPDFVRLALLLTERWDWDPLAEPRNGASRETRKVTCKLTLGSETRRELARRYDSRVSSLDEFAVVVLQNIAAGGGLKALLEKLRKDKKGEDEGAVFTFCDLFAGIGGIRLAFESAGGRCVYSSEWDKFAKRTYCLNHLEWPAGNIYDRQPGDIQDHNILTGGFPCQPFSLAGVSKKNALGRKHGFEDKTQGPLFFEIRDILAERKPEMFLLENVKNLRGHNGGDTFRTIKAEIKRLGYKLFCKVVDAKDYLPQHRERIFLVGVKRGKLKKNSGEVPGFVFPRKPSEKISTLEEILEPDDSNVEKYRLTPKLWGYLQEYARKHQAAGNGFGFSRFERGKDEVVRTLSARYHKDGSEILVKMNSGVPDTRRLTPEECRKLMGFPGDFRIRDVVSDTQAYRQFGNSVAVPVVEAIAQEMVKYYETYF